ncbi:hypothetical protein IIA15_07510, partial [candidate division TA06 bacterium]|nr:hypothetical protein [candidate division TA06 bacterium]
MDLTDKSTKSKNHALLIRNIFTLVFTASLVIFHLAPQASSDQLLPNTSFETWSEVLGVLIPDGWFTTAPLDSLSATRSTNAHNGTYSLKMSQRGIVFGSFSVDDLVRVVGDNPYDFNIWTKNILSVGVLWFIQYNADTSIAFD